MEAIDLLIRDDKGKLCLDTTLEKEKRALKTITHTHISTENAFRKIW